MYQGCRRVCRRDLICVLVVDHEVAVGHVGRRGGRVVVERAAVRIADLGARASRGALA